MSNILNQILRLGFVRDFLDADPLVLVDVGARSGIHERWAALGKSLRVIGFEPDKTECDRLNAGIKNNGSARHSFLATALSDRSGNRSLHLTNSPGCSSMLEPNSRFLARFPDSNRFCIQRTVDVPVDTLDNVLASEGATPDFAKLDVQGAEMEVLRGAEKTLGSLLGLEIEVEFAELYKGQPLFAHIDEFMRSRGFALFDLKRCWWKRQGGEKTANHRGQLIFGDAFYLKDLIASDAPVTRARLLKNILIAVLYDKNDYVVEMAQFGKEKGVLTETEAGDIRRLALSAPGIMGSLPNVRGRYWLARWFQRFSNAVAPKSWGPSDILW